jgi:RimJ/RimL family protein N-acetyltransferase
MLTTARLRLRPWRAGDLEPFAALNADSAVMAHMPELLDRAASDAFIDRTCAHFDQHGFGLWAVAVPRVSDFIGYVGLSVPRFSAAFTPCVEVGWRLAAQFWGRGYATEAARACVSFAFDQARLNEIVSMAVPENIRSTNVMERLGMTHNPADDFDHPMLPDRRRHVLYRLRPHR